MPPRNRRRPVGIAGAPTEAWFYGRVSLDRDGNMLAVSRQWDEAGPPMGARLGLPITRRFEDNSISATSGDIRPGFEELLHALHKAPYPKPAVIVWHIDRLVRITPELERVIATDVNVYALHAGHIDLSTPAGRAVARTVVAWATYEGEIKAERQAAKFAQMARAGQRHWSARPFGYNMDGTINPEEAAALRDAYDQVIDGKTLGWIARDLTAKGFRGSRGGVFSAETIAFVLKSPRNIAIREHHGEEVGPAQWEPIITEEKFRTAMLVLKDPRRQKYVSSGSEQSLLSGIAECGVCHESVKASKRYNMWSSGRTNQDMGGPNPTRQSYATYKCVDRGCVGHIMSAVDTLVRQAATILLTDRTHRGRWLSAGGEDKASLRAEAVVLNARLDEIADDRADGTMTKEQAARATERVLARLAVIESEHAAERRELLRVWELHQSVEGMPMDQQRQMIRSLLPKIELMPQRRGARHHDPATVRIFRRGADGQLEQIDPRILRAVGDLVDGRQATARTSRTMSARGRAKR